jgi:DNA replication protein DnaC
MRNRYASEKLGACPECQKPFTGSDLVMMGVTEDEAAEWMRRTDGISAMVARMPYTCERCIFHAQHQNAMEREASRWRKLRHHTYESGRMPIDAKGETVEASTEAIMRRNPDAWILAGKPLASNLWVMGAPGTGKTYLAHALANEALSRGFAVASIRGERINAIGDLFDDKRQAAMKDIRAVYLLVIDDIDKPTYSARGLDCMLALMDARMRAKAITIMTANTSGAWLAGKWKQIRPDNHSIAASIMERMLPIQKIELHGGSLRAATVAPEPHHPPAPTTQARHQDETYEEDPY